MSRRKGGPTCDVAGRGTLVRKRKKKRDT